MIICRNRSSIKYVHPQGMKHILLNEDTKWFDETHDSPNGLNNITFINLSWLHARFTFFQHHDDMSFIKYKAHAFLYLNCTHADISKKYVLFLQAQQFNVWIHVSTTCFSFWFCVLFRLLRDLFRCFMKVSGYI